MDTHCTDKEYPMKDKPKQTDYLSQTVLNLVNNVMI